MNSSTEHGGPGAEPASEFHVGIDYLHGTPVATVDDFVAAVDAPGLVLRTRCRDVEAQASVEWLMPTFVVAYLTRAYFDGFLGEMGKDHYRLLRRSLISLGNRLLGPTGPPAVLVSASGRLSSGKRFSIIYSIEAETDQCRSIKLLLPKAVSERELADAVEAFTDLLLDHDRLSTTVDEYGQLVPFDPVLTWFDPQSQQIAVVDPVPPEVRRRGRS